MSHLADLGLDAAGDAALLKLVAALPAVYRPVAERALERIHLDAEVWFHAAEDVPYLSVIQEAVWQDRKLHLVYRRSNCTLTEGVAEPLGLVAKARVWYLVAREVGSTRVFRVSRIQDAALLDEHVTRPDAFDLRAYWAAWCAEFERSIPRYPVAVRVAPAAMPRLQHLLGDEVNLHLEQASQPDARGWRTIPVTFERVDDARRALLGCGTLVEVVEPWELRESIAAAAADVAALYAQ